MPPGSDGELLLGKRFVHPVRCMDNTDNVRTVYDVRTTPCRKNQQVLIHTFNVKRPLNYIHMYKDGVGHIWRIHGSVEPEWKALY